MKTPKEFAKEVSPTKDGMRHQLELMHLDKHIYEWMRRYAIEYHESEVLKLNKANVIKSVCSLCKKEIEVNRESNLFCDECWETL